MDEQQAEALAKVIGGEAWQSGGGIYVVALRRPDGSIVVFSDDLVAEYPDDDAFDAAQPSASIMLRDDPTEYRVIQDEEGGVMLADPDHGRGWPSEEEAEHEARYRIPNRVEDVGAASTLGRHHPDQGPVVRAGSSPVQTLQDALAEDSAIGRRAIQRARH